MTARLFLAQRPQLSQTLDISTVFLSNAEAGGNDMNVLNRNRLIFIVVIFSAIISTYAFSEYPKPGTVTHIYQPGDHPENKLNSKAEIINNTDRSLCASIEIVNKNGGKAGYPNRAFPPNGRVSYSTYNYKDLYIYKCNSIGSDNLIMKTNVENVYIKINLGDYIK